MTQDVGTQVTPLGPDSLTWRLFGDWRGLLQGPWAGSMQNMHPQLGAAVEQHSIFFTERWQRLYRSLYPIGGVVFDGDRAPRTGREVRDYHRGISGVDAQGRKYNALNPEVFFWAHATFVMGTLRVQDYFGYPLTDDQKEQLWAEGIQWYSMYGMPMHDLPQDWAAFQAYWDRMCTEVLEDNKATRDVLDLSELAKPPYAPWLPEWAWRLLRIPVAKGFVWLTVGMYDDPVRRLLGYSWTERDELAMRAIRLVVRNAWRLVPFERRFHPRARAAWQRASGKLPADAPLPETPARNLPPLAYRDSPHHYSPKP
ncbi:oxygenase MpaB family protein [Pseudonocardia spinosispora]|uniref:oxygenase MpaB family protein n=1 Tax=Pseudonocardia spinosispora TaxID=103441 RepID=UPI0004022638|nr:oxygenase MpaB family protein [Pseudonocardia spinosispora]